MEKIYLNELSLTGQFENMDDFLNASVSMMKCLKFIQQRQGKVYKHSTFYLQKIAKNCIWNDLRRERSDQARRLKSLLLSTTDSPPFWDMEENLVQNLNSQYIFHGEDVTATSVAEAAEAQAILLSFARSDRYENKEIVVLKDEELELTAESAVSLDYLAEQLWKRKDLDLQEYLCRKYEGSRLNFSKLEHDYGFHDFEKKEIRDCLQTFDKFVQFDTWEEIFQDQGLRYKRYMPSAEDKNWFKGQQYADKEIDKFRCINPKRCFGYREKDVFYVLRMERDHKISDFG